MTRRDFLIKWAVYAAALLPVWFFEQSVLSHISVFGASPVLLPLAAVSVAVLEGPLGGAGFGLGVGILCDAVYFGVPGGMTLGITLLALASGGAARSILHRGFWGCLICSTGALTLMDGARVLVYLARGQAAGALLRLAAAEVLVSLLFVGPVYLIFRWVHSRVQFSTLF